ncbi:hypothetical protein SAMN05192546_103121 [Tindallia californiensis]|uniref:Uncharacterized protein n=1 Tax=Tindallia californiensis TaxID=159292 RepID=A0A1H3L9M9_9FIRM|nr:hypothetical protein SAMN05192546_103121 [Tindallia californiensis]
MEKMGKTEVTKIVFHILKSQVQKLNKSRLNDFYRTEADLVFAPTLACWKVCSGFAVTPLLSSIIARQDLLLSRTMLHNTFGCVTWVLLPATGMDLQPQTFCSVSIIPYNHIAVRLFSLDTMILFFFFVHK